MTKRLQILLSEVDFEQLRVVARANDVSVGEWVRQAIHRSFAVPGSRAKEAKLSAVREAMALYAPAPDIDQTNREIEEGYLSGLP